MSLKHFFILLIVTFLWGLNNVIIKFGFHHFPPMFMTFMRFLVVSLILIPFQKITFKQVKCILPLSFTFGILHFALLFIGIKYTDPGTGSIIVQFGTPFSIFLATLILNERLNILQILGIIISFIGILVLIGSPNITHWLGVVALLGSAIGWATSNIIIKKLSTVIPPLTIIGWISFLSMPFVGISSFIFESEQLTLLANASWKDLFTILYTGIVSSIIAYALWYYILSKYQMNDVMPYSLLTPIFAILMSVIILGDNLNVFKIIGATLVLLGTAFSVFKKDFFGKNAKNQ